MKALLYILALSTGFTSALAQAQETVPIERCGLLTESLSVWVDTSGSMMKTVNGKNRFDDVHTLLNKIAHAALPHGSVETSVYSIAPYARILNPEYRDAVAFQKDLDKRMPKMEVMGRPTLIGQKTMDLFSTSHDQNKTILFITDGVVTRSSNGNSESTIEKALTNFAKANPNTCIHLISTAETDEEHAAIAQLQSSAICTKVNHLRALIDDEAQFGSFIEELFYKDCSRVHLQALLPVHFGFDSSELTSQGKDYLLNALNFIKYQSALGTVAIQGWTDSTGEVNYNKNLSQKRAQSVKNYLVENGCDGTRLEVKGMGVSQQYSNATLDGRKQNRRVQIHFSEK